MYLASSIFSGSIQLGSVTAYQNMALIGATMGMFAYPYYRILGFVSLIDNLLNDKIDCVPVYTHIISTER